MVIEGEDVLKFDEKHVDGGRRERGAIGMTAIATSMGRDVSTLARVSPAAPTV